MAIEPARTGLERFIGRLASSQTVPFGGSPYCMYSMTLKDIVLDVTTHPDDGLVTMLVADTIDEKIVGSCPYGVTTGNRQLFDHRDGPVLPNLMDAYVPDLAGAPTNSPRVAVTATVVADKTPLEASLRWRRTDQSAPLDWVVETTTPIVLERVSCEVGDVYCLGGSTQGSEYGCIDGVHFEQLKRCTNGCAPSTRLPPMTHDDEQCR